MRFNIPKVDKETAALFVASFFIAQSISLMSPVIPEIKNEFGLSYTAASVILSVFGISRLILSLPAGYLYERMNRKKMLMLGVMLLSFGSLIAGFSKDFATFLASQAIIGAGFSVCITSIIVSLSRSSTKENRGRLLGMNTFSRSFGAIIAPTLAGFIAVAFTWRSVFLFYAGISALCLIILYFMLSGESGKIRETEEAPPARNYRRTLYGIFIIMLVTNFVFAGFRSSTIPLYASDMLKMDAQQIGFMLSVSAVVFLVFAPLSAYLSDRHGRRIFIILATFAYTASVFGFIAAKSSLHLMFLMVLFGYGSIVFVSSTAMLGDITHAKKASRNYSIMRFVADFGTVIGPLATGFLLDSYGFTTTGMFFGAVSFFAFLVALYVLEEPDSRLDWKRILSILTFGRFGE